MDTKLKGDIAETEATLYAMKCGWGVLQPIGDRMPYDLVFDITGTLVRVQVKSAWFNEPTQNWVVDNRRTKTNRKVMKREPYDAKDFDFALLYIEDADVFYVMPVEVFISYGGPIHLVETNKRQRKPRSAEFRDTWNLITEWAVRKETSV